VGNLYEREICQIYQPNLAGDLDNKVMDLLDQELNNIPLINNQTILTITTHEDYLTEDSINIIPKSHSFILDKSEVKDYKIVDSLLDLNIEKESLDELVVMNTISLIELEDYDKYLEYWISLLKPNKYIYIQDICFDNIMKYYFMPHPNNNNQITPDLLKMGLSSIYGKNEYKRRSIIIPLVLLTILTKYNISNVEMQERGTLILIRGIKEGTNNVIIC
jgi:hypothetical protein